MLSSCSQDDIVSNNNGSDDLVPIQIGVGSATVNTRGTGTGTVGTTDASTNFWNGELVNITMFNKGTLVLAENKDGVIFEGEEFVTPVGENGSTSYAKPTNNVIHYYPTTGEYDFYGVHLDSAASMTNAVLDSAAYTIDFTIDGSHDLMAAQACPAEGAGYSAKAARNGTHPQLQFNHLLSRFTIEVLANGEAADSVYPVIIDSISIMSKANGTLTIADSLGNAPHISAWSDSANYSPLYLNNLSADNTFSLAKDTVYTQIRDAILVAPGDSTYTLNVVMHQSKPVNYLDPTSTSTVRSELKDLKITIPNNEVGKAGYSYTVKLVIYGLEEIKVYTILTPWQEGDIIPIDPDNIQ